MSEHKKNAEWLLRRAIHYREQAAHKSADSVALAAQAEATLALVEQQRIANLIEYLRTAASAGAEHSPEAVAWMDDLAVEIREGLEI